MPLSRTESVARNLFKHYCPSLKTTYGIRPTWLKWPVTGNNLELDIWFPAIKAAVEVNGIQHGRNVPGMQKDFAAFERQQTRDAWKNEECKRLGITLYSLTSFDLTQRRFEPFMRQFAATHNLVLNRYAAPPTQLFAEAEQLTRQKAPHVHPARRKPGFLNFLRRVIK